MVACKTRTIERILHLAAKLQLGGVELAAERVVPKLELGNQKG
jgi:hypothetical protein